MSVDNAEQLAKLFHETYEKLAPLHGYETREASAKPWEEVPKNNRDLMIATCERVLETVHKLQPKQELWVAVMLSDRGADAVVGVSDSWDGADDLITADMNDNETQRDEYDISEVTLNERT